jgi:hypothetical protein
LKGGFEVATLRADSRAEEPQVGGCLADFSQGLGLRGPDDETDVVTGVPGVGEAGDVEVEGACSVDMQVLKVSGPWVRGFAEEEYSVF